MDKFYLLEKKNVWHTIATGPFISQKLLIEYAYECLNKSINVIFLIKKFNLFISPRLQNGGFFLN